MCSQLSSTQLGPSSGSARVLLEEGVKGMHPIRQTQLAPREVRRLRILLPARLVQRFGKVVVSLLMRPLRVREATKLKVSILLRPVVLQRARQLQLPLGARLGRLSVSRADHAQVTARQRLPGE